ncbi:hypothetical protein [Priestia flexa]|uniref:hypothetical protein n=1 Tax=Priestia flexa TaxID=86664 RepID=UPI00249005B8|nr:hypothetical protein [Priestia flexa]
MKKNIGASKEEMFETWVTELGYNKAVLISCCYPIKTVIEQSEEWAEAEVEAIS